MSIWLKQAMRHSQGCHTVISKVCPYLHYYVSENIRVLIYYFL